MKSPGVKWLTNNLLRILTLLAGLIFAWAVLNTRVSAIEKKVSQYPSQDWFELKFEGIDESIEALKAEVSRLNP